VAEAVEEALVVPQLWAAAGEVLLLWEEVVVEEARPLLAEVEQPASAALISGLVLRRPHRGIR
jgi:hypothetical protein